MGKRSKYPDGCPTWRCPAGCGRELNFLDGLRACTQCGRWHCLHCVRWWPLDDNTDEPLCKTHWRIRQAASSAAGVDKKKQSG